MAKSRGVKKKTAGQARVYREFVNNMTSPEEETIMQGNQMLIGTKELNFEQDCLEENEKIRKRPFKYILLDWIKRNLLAGLIVAAIVGISTATIAHKVKIAVIEQRISYVEERLDRLESNQISKDYIESQLDYIETVIKNDNILSVREIEWRLKDIEERIEDSGIK